MKKRLRLSQIKLQITGDENILITKVAELSLVRSVAYSLALCSFPKKEKKTHNLMPNASMRIEHYVRKALLFFLRATILKDEARKKSAEAYFFFFA